MEFSSRHYGLSVGLKNAKWLKANTPLYDNENPFATTCILVPRILIWLRTCQVLLLIMYPRQIRNCLKKEIQALAVCIICKIRTRWESRWCRQIWFVVLPSIDIVWFGHYRCVIFSTIIDDHKYKLCEIDGLSQCK